MDLEFFEVEINGRKHPVPKKEIQPIEGYLNESTFHIQIWDSTIEASKWLIEKEDIKSISVSKIKLCSSASQPQDSVHTEQQLCFKSNDRTGLAFSLNGENKVERRQSFEEM